MKRTGKLLYVPGLISLIGLLIMLPSFYKRNMPAKEYCITMFMPKDCNRDKDLTFDYTTCYIEKEIKGKKQIKFTLDYNKKENKRKMEMIRYESLKLKYTEDTATVVVINLSDSITYGDFISIFDMCVADGHKRYGSWDDRFVIFGEWPEKKKELPELSLIRCGYQHPEKPIVRPSFIDLIKQKIIEYYSPKGFYLLAGWIVLFISFLYFRKRSSVLQKN